MPRMFCALVASGAESSVRVKGVPVPVTQRPSDPSSFWLAAFQVGILPSVAPLGSSRRRGIRLALELGAWTFWPRPATQENKSAQRVARMLILDFIIFLGVKRRRRRSVSPGG